MFNTGTLLIWRIKLEECSPEIRFTQIVNVNFLVFCYWIDNYSLQKNPGLRRLWYWFQTTVIAKHIELAKIWTKHIKLTNFQIKTCRLDYFYGKTRGLDYIICFSTPTKRLMYFYRHFSPSISNLNYLSNLHRYDCIIGTNFYLRYLWVVNNISQFLTRAILHLHNINSKMN